MNFDTWITFVILNVWSIMYRYKNLEINTQNLSLKLDDFSIFGNCNAYS